jgi:hypothetical protein
MREIDVSHGILCGGLIDLHGDRDCDLVSSRVGSVLSRDGKMIFAVEIPASVGGNWTNARRESKKRAKLARRGSLFGCKR